jgi:hypothetical protein
MQMTETERRPALISMRVKGVFVRRTLEQFGEDCLSNARRIGSHQCAIRTHGAPQPIGMTHSSLAPLVLTIRDHLLSS